MYKKGSFFGIENLKNVRVMVTLALFVSISIVTGKFLAISVGETLRFSFENLTIILSGILFGPIPGAITGIVADLIGCILRGYAINPILTIGAMTIGFLSGVLYNLLKNTPSFLRIAISVFSAHLIGSVIIKSFGLLIVSFDIKLNRLFFRLFFRLLLNNLPVVTTLIISRCANYAVVFVAEFIVIMLLMKNRGFINQINRIRGNRR